MSDTIEEIKKMNIYEKMQKVKKLLSDAELKKTGKNNYSNFEYYELSNILPAIITFCENYRLFTHVNFVKEYSAKTITTEGSQVQEKVKVGESAVLTVINIDNPKEKIEYSSDVKDLELKAANAIQNYGGIQTYSRRYLYMNAFDIVEAEMFDKEMNKKKKQATKQSNAIKNFINTCSKKYIGLNDTKRKEKIAEKLKELGYTNFKDIEKKNNRKDMVELAQILEVEFPEELKENEESK